jgi:hypothetical protein
MFSDTSTSVQLSKRKPTVACGVMEGVGEIVAVGVAVVVKVVVAVGDIAVAVGVWLGVTVLVAVAVAVAVAVGVGVGVLSAWQALPSNTNTSKNRWIFIITIPDDRVSS